MVRVPEDRVSLSLSLSLSLSFSLFRVSSTIKEAERSPGARDNQVVKLTDRNPSERLASAVPHLPAGPWPRPPPPPPPPPPPSIFLSFLFSHLIGLGPSLFANVTPIRNIHLHLSFLHFYSFVCIFCISKKPNLTRGYPHVKLFSVFFFLLALTLFEVIIRFESFWNLTT